MVVLVAVVVVVIVVVKHICKMEAQTQRETSLNNRQPRRNELWNEK